MLLADGGFVLISFGLLFLFGFGVIYLALWIAMQVLRGLGAGFRAVFGGGEPAPPHLRPLPKSAGQQVCLHTRCGHFNPVAARFCARCGRPLQAASAWHG